MPIVTRGFRRRGDGDDGNRLPPGQHLVGGFPVLSAGPTPHTPLEDWSFTIRGAVATERSWTWDELRALPSETFSRDIHCVTSWSKLDTRWEGVSLDVLFDGLEPQGGFVVAYCDGGYTTNLPLDDVLGGRAWVAYGYDGGPLDPEHGGPARLLVPHLYFWKSAKWVRGLEVATHDRLGFWEELGYHEYGDPWREQRYRGD